MAPGRVGPKTVSMGPFFRPSSPPNGNDPAHSFLFLPPVPGQKVLPRLDAVRWDTFGPDRRDFVCLFPVRNSDGPPPRCLHLGRAGDDQRFPFARIVAKFCRGFAGCKHRFQFPERRVKFKAGGPSSYRPSGPGRRRDLPFDRRSEPARLSERQAIMDDRVDSFRQLAGDFQRCVDAGMRLLCSLVQAVDENSSKVPLLYGDDDARERFVELAEMAGKLLFGQSAGPSCATRWILHLFELAADSDSAISARAERIQHTGEAERWAAVASKKRLELEAVSSPQGVALWGSEFPELNPEALVIDNVFRASAAAINFHWKQEICARAAEKMRDICARGNATIMTNIAREQAALARVSQAVMRVPAKGTNETASVANAGKTTWQEAAEELKKRRQRGEPFASYGDMAEKLGCSPATIDKAVKRTPDLKEWAEKPKGSALGMPSLDTTGRANEIPAATPCSADDTLEQFDVDAAMEYLLSKANETERETIRAMPAEKQRQMASLAYDDKDKAEQIWRYREAKKSTS